MSSNDIIIGSKFNYKIDKSHGLSGDGYIATGTESIVYKGLKVSLDGKISLSCVLKFKRKYIKVGTDNGEYKVINVYDKFKTNDLKIFDELQDCRSVVRIFDVIEDLGDFSVTDSHVPEGSESISIDSSNYFCVVEEYVDGWSLEEYCRDEYWKLTKIVDVGNNIKKKISFHEFTPKVQDEILGAYKRDYDEIIRYQSEMLGFMINLCEIMEYITDQKKILHLDIKPDNIMVTRYGKELVLIDFGRAQHIDIPSDSVMSRLGETNYNNDQTPAHMYQYGTLGYAAPECFAEPMTGSKFPFERDGITVGKMSIQSDIFSFGACFWECLSMFELCTGSNEFNSDKSLNGTYDFYRNYMLNDKAYCDRDLSIASSHYHEKLERIIQKCTRKRVKGFDIIGSPVYNQYYHDYKSILDDIKEAKESAPAIVKTENIKVRNSFGVAGVMAGLMCSVLLLCGFLKLTGSYFAERKMDTIMQGYNPTQIERLENAAVEQMQSSTDAEKQNVYNKVYDFFIKNDNLLDYSETVVLVDLLNEISSKGFIADSADKLMLEVEQKGFSNCIEYTVTHLDNCDSVGYDLAVQIYNAQNRKNLSECYQVLSENADNHKYDKLIKRLAQDLNHDEFISKIAEESVTTNAEKDSTEYFNAIAEKKNEIKILLDSISRGEISEPDR